MTQLKKSMAISSFIIFFSIISTWAETNQYGSTFNDTISLKPISIIFDSADIDGNVLSFQGAITAVCKNDGCWFKFKDDSGEVLVDLKPYDFRLPEEIVGREVKLNGRVNTKGGKTKVDAISVIILE